MEYSSKEIKVGFMVVMGFTLLVVFLIAIFGINWQDNTKEYKTYLESVPGIVEGSLVKYGGMDVGYVSQVKLPEISSNDSKIRLTLKVNEDTPVRENSTAYVTSVSLMTQQHIEVSPGTLDAPLLAAGSVLQSKEVLSFTQMAEPFAELSTDARLLLTQLNEMLNDKNLQHISNMVANMDSVLNSGGDQFVSMITNMEKITGNLTQVSADLNELMGKNKENFDETLKHVQTTTAETSELIKDLRKTISGFESLVSANGSSIIEIMENFQYASQNFEEFTRMVKERPWLLVRKSAPPERDMP